MLRVKGRLRNFSEMSKFSQRTCSFSLQLQKLLITLDSEKRVCKQLICQSNVSEEKRIEKYKHLERLSTISEYKNKSTLSTFEPFPNDLKHKHSTLICLIL